MKKIFAAMILISTFSSMVLSFAIFNRQNAFEAKLETLSDKQNSLEGKMEVLSDKVEVLSKKVDELASDVKVLSVRMDGLEKRMDGLEKRVDKLEERNESRLDLMLSAFAAGVAWLTLVATVLTFKKSGSEIHQPQTQVTLADMQRLIEENNAKLNLSPKS